MSLHVSASSNGNFELVPEGQYIARCFRIIDIGTQWVEWKGTQKEQKKVLIMWELLDDKVKMADNKPFAITKRYTASLDERSALYGDLEAWRGKKFSNEELEDFDLKKVLGAYCQLQIVHSEDGKYANANSIMGFKGDKPEGVNPLVYFDVDEPDMEVFNSFSDKLKEQIEKSPEFRIATDKTVIDNSEKGKATDRSLEDLPGGTNFDKNKEDDIVIENIDDEPINLNDIAF